MEDMRRSGAKVEGGGNRKTNAGTGEQDPWGGCRRQVHLDFHNSPYIEDLLADFDAEEVAARFEAASVNSVVVFTKCVHGMAYYPSNVVKPHPALRGRDFTGEMIEALHRRGIRAPLYTIVGWEENLAQTKPEWMQICADGTFAQNDTSSDGHTRQPGRYRWLNFLHPDYQGYLQAHFQELLERYPCDGFFVDMLVVHPEADWSDHAVAFRERHGLMGRDRRTHARFETAAQVAFAKTFTAQIRARRPQASIFYNAENRLYSSGALGVLARKKFQTHFEIESLPAGMWNYRHFPRVARNLRQKGPWLGMTGRFQQMWGDFGGIKSDAALEFECFRTQALGGANSVGDQLHPRGTLDGGAYALIGGVYAQCRAAEPFYAGTRACPEVAVLCPHDPEREEHRTTLVEEGLVALCQENHYDAAIVNDGDSLAGFRVVLLGEGGVITPRMRRRLTDFVARGGRILAAGEGIFDEEGRGWGPFQKVTRVGEGEFAPTYVRAREGSPLETTLGRDDRVIYQRGLVVKAARDVSVWADRVLPYFQRSDLRFCSHFQAPPRPTPSRQPAVIASGAWVYFADPIFSEYRQSANLAVARMVAAALRHLVGPGPHGHGLKSTVRLYPLRAGNDLRLTLLHYLPERRALEAEVVAERLGFGGQTLRFPREVGVVRVFGEEEILPRTAEGGFGLPVREGRLLLEVLGYFRRGR